MSGAGLPVAASSWRSGAAAYSGASLPPVPRDWPHRELSRSREAAGTRWHVQRTGGAGPRLLLIHGTGASTHTWRGLLPRLGQDFDVLAPDLPGHGYSGPLPDGAMSLPALAGGLAALLQAEAFAPDFVVGHSAGAAILLQMTLDGAIEPDAVVGLNAALRPYGGPLHALVRPLTRWLAGGRLLPLILARRAQDAGAVRRVLESTGSALDDEGVALYQRLLQRPRHVAAVLAMMGSWDLAPLLQRLPSLACRLWLIAALGDRAVRPAEAAAIARRVPGAEVIELEGCGHLAHEERPGAVAELIRGCCLAAPVGGG